VAQQDLRKVRRAATRVAKAHEALAAAILAAQDSGESLRDIATYAGLGYSRVYELAREARRRREQQPG
jgi:hypothetical protein